MIVVVIVLAALAALLAAVVWATRRRLGAQQALTAAAEERASAAATELASVVEARDDAERRRAEAEERATNADARRAELESQSRNAEDRAAAAIQRAEASEAAHDQADRRAAAAEAARREAEERLAAFEERAAASSSGSGALDAEVVWALEKARSARTWRQSVAVDPDGSAFTPSSDPLHEALQIELDAAREDVGAYVELDAELPANVTAAGALLTLRAAQELLAEVVRRSESTTLQVRTSGADIVVDVQSLGEDGTPIEPGRLPTPPSPAFETTSTGVRIRNAVAQSAPD